MSANPALIIEPRILAPEPQPALAALHESAVDDEDLSDSDVAPASAIPRRFSRAQSKGASSSEVRRLSNSASSSIRMSPANVSGGEGSSVDRLRARTGSSSQNSRKPSLTASLRPSAIFHIDSPVLAVDQIAQARGDFDEGKVAPLVSLRGATMAAAVSSGRTVGQPLSARDGQSQGESKDAQEMEGLPPVNGVASFEVDDGSSVPEHDPRATGTLRSTKGILILSIISASQLLDNVSMTSVNMALTAISTELDIKPADEQWLISAYTMVFGGFLLLAGVFADRWGKKRVFVAGMAWLSLWTLIDGFAKTGIQLIIFRALQGLGAAATVPSSVGIISSFFVGRERNTALAIFGSAGAIGFVLGLIYGGLFTTLLGWRWVFWLTCPIGVIVAASGAWLLPDNRAPRSGPKPSLDFLGAGFGTCGLLLLTFVLSSGGVYGWGKGFIIALIVISVSLLVAFALAERKVKNPILPSHLWAQPGFAVSFSLGFVVYMWWQAVVLYMTIISQNVLKFSPLQTAIRFIPMGPTGLIASFWVAWAVNHYKIKHLLVGGMLLSMLSGIPTCVMHENTSFWASIFPSSIMGVAGISIVYNVISISMMAAVPPAAKSLAGGLINTAFQIGSGCGLAVCSAVITAVSKKATGEATHILLEGYKAAMWTSVGFCGIGLLLAIFGIKGAMLEVDGPAPVH